MNTKANDSFNRKGYKMNFKYECRTDNKATFCYKTQ